MIITILTTNSIYLLKKDSITVTKLMYLESKEVINHYLVIDQHHLRDLMTLLYSISLMLYYLLQFY